MLSSVLYSSRKLAFNFEASLFITFVIYTSVHYGEIFVTVRPDIGETDANQQTNVNNRQQVPECPHFRQRLCRRSRLKDQARAHATHRPYGFAIAGQADRLDRLRRPWHKLRRAEYNRSG